MAVDDSKKNDGELLAYTASRKLFDYVYDITRNNFNKPDEAEEVKPDHKWLCDEIRRMCLYIVLDIVSANAKRLDKADERAERLALQNGVDEMYRRLSAMVLIAHEKKLIKSKRVKSWDREIEKAQVLLRAWRKSDKERSKGL